MNKGDLVKLVEDDAVLLGFPILVLEPATEDLPRKWLIISISDETGRATQHRKYENEVLVVERRDYDPADAVGFVVWHALHSGIDWSAT